MPRNLTTYEAKRDYSIALTERFSQDMRGLADTFNAGDIDLLSWHVEMRDMLRKEYALQLITAAGGDVANVDPNDWLRLGNMLKSQYGYLEDFANEIKAGDLSPEMVAYRSTMYAESAKQAFWKQLTKDVTLPAMPGDGSSECKTNCNCAWEQNGDSWSWVLGGNDNCETCLQRSTEWNPYSEGE